MCNLQHVSLVVVCNDYVYKIGCHRNLITLSEPPYFLPLLNKIFRGKSVEISRNSVENSNHDPLNTNILYGCGNVTIFSFFFEII